MSNIDYKELTKISESSSVVHLSKEDRAAINAMIYEEVTQSNYRSYDDEVPKFSFLIDLSGGRYEAEFDSGGSVDVHYTTSSEEWGDIDIFKSFYFNGEPTLTLWDTETWDEVKSDFEFDDIETNFV